LSAACRTRVNKILDAVGNSDLEVNVKTPDARHLLNGFEKIANRVTTGIILAALIVGAALMMRINSSFQILGYPGIAMICFLIATGGSAWLVLGILWKDYKDKRRIGLWSLALCILNLTKPAIAAGTGTMLILQNPTNSSPRIVSMWGGGGSEQIVMKSDGTVWDWGYNQEGELGNGTTNNADLPLQVLGPGGTGYLAPVAAIQGGELHNTALKANGTVWSWGLNEYGQLGDGSTNWGNNGNLSTTPVQVYGLTNVKSLGGRGYHTLALKTDGTVWAWGRNEYGELGIGVAFDSGNNGFGQGTNIPVQVIGLTNPASLSAAGFSAWPSCPTAPSWLGAKITTANAATGPTPIVCCPFRSWG
jgi:hypothetical protein